MTLLDRFMSGMIACRCKSQQQKDFVVEMADKMGYRTYPPYDVNIIYFYNEGLLGMYVDTRLPYDFEEIFKEEY